MSSEFDKGWNAALDFVRKRVGFYLSDADAEAIRFYICKSAERNGVRLYEKNE